MHAFDWFTLNEMEQTSNNFESLPEFFIDRKQIVISQWLNDA